MDAKITKSELQKLASEKLWHGEYVATDRFRSIERHASVCFDNGMLVAVTGPAGDRESQLYAALFADAPAMLNEIVRLRAALEIAISALSDESISRSDRLQKALRVRAMLHSARPDDPK